MNKQALIEQALDAALEQVESGAIAALPVGPSIGEPVGFPLRPALERLPQGRRPRPEPVCARCPRAVWFGSANSVSCYCRLMHVLTWTSEEPKPLLFCDGFSAAEM